MNLIFNHQKKEEDNEGIFLQNLYPIVVQDDFLKIKSITGLYHAINRLKNEKLIKITRIKKLPPENIIKITKKGITELDNFLKMFEMGFKDDKDDNEIDALSKSQAKVQSLITSLEQSKSQIKSLKQQIQQEPQIQKVEIEKLKDLKKDEIAVLTQEVAQKIVNGINKDCQKLTLEENKRIQRTAEDIVEYVREY